jgi:SagB-type dehydrogenase family enzyme
MNHIDTTDPRPRESPLSYGPCKLGSGPARYLDAPKESGNVQFWDVVARRRTTRTFRAIDDASLGSLLWHSFKTTSRSQSSGRVWEHRPIPSAGGLHPILALVQSPRRDGCPLLEYDPIGHALREVSATSTACAELYAHANTVVDTQDGTVLWLIGDYNKVHAYYEHGSSLLWKDTGIVLGALCLVAEALELNACPLGVCGHSWLKSTIALPDGIEGVGAIVVGRRP